LFAGGVLTEATTSSESGVVDLSFKSELVKYILPIRLFGCSYSNQMVEGRLLIGHLLPICKELRDYIGIDSDISFYQLITRAFQTRRDELRAERSRDEQAVQMLVEYEVFAPGTQFYHEIVLETTREGEEIDLATLYRAIKLWKQNPVIGGKSSIGFGKIKIEYEFPENVSDKPYLEFVEKNREKIIEVLNKLRDRL